MILEQFFELKAEFSLTVFSVNLLTFGDKIQGNHDFMNTKTEKVEIERYLELPEDQKGIITAYMSSNNVVTKDKRLRKSVEHFNRAVKTLGTQDDSNH